MINNKVIDTLNNRLIHKRSANQYMIDIDRLIQYYKQAPTKSNSSIEDVAKNIISLKIPIEYLSSNLYLLVNNNKFLDASEKSRLLLIIKDYYMDLTNKLIRK